MGIDIREGSQLECIQCALCIDACDEIMDRVSRPRGLIAYDTFRNLEVTHSERAPVRIVRPRTLLYSGLIAAVAGIMLFSWLTRSLVQISVLHDRNPVFVQLSDGGLRNGFTVKILNKRYERRSFTLAVAGLDGAEMSIVGFAHPDAAIEVAPDDVRSLKVFVTLPAERRSTLDDGAAPFRFTITDTQEGSTMDHEAIFKGPAHE
jgi:polyferredoxin